MRKSLCQRKALGRIQEAHCATASKSLRSQPSTLSPWRLAYSCRSTPMYTAGLNSAAANMGIRFASGRDEGGESMPPEHESTNDEQAPEQRICYPGDARLERS